MTFRLKPSPTSRLILCMSLLPFVFMSWANAQEKGTSLTGTLDGRLTDWHSVPLVQASVLLHNLATGATFHGTTGKNGSYRFIGVSPGEYRLEADVPQLGKGAVEGILVSAGHISRVQAALVMELPPLPDSTEADLNALDPVAPAVTTIIASEEAGALPLSSRNWQQLAALTPGAHPAPQGTGAKGGQLGDPGEGESSSESSGGLLSQEAGAGSPTAETVDGVESTPAFHAEANQQREGESLGESAVIDMQARAGNAPADQGHSPAGVVTLTTGRGTNGLHGQLLYRNRQGLWGARNPFTQWVQETAPAAGIDTAQFTPQPYSPASSRQSFGLGLGSQLKRNKLFWFASLDALFRSDPAVATVRHPAQFFARPSDDELKVLSARLDLPGPAFLEQSVAAYSTGLESLAGLLGPVPRSHRQWQGFGRLDWQASERNHLALEGNAANVDAPAGALTRSSQTYGSHSFGNRNASSTWALATWQSFLSPNLLNVLAAEFRSRIQSDTPQAPSAFEAPLLANGFGQLPEMIVDTRYGFILGKPARLGHSKHPDEQFFVAQDTLSWVRGSHLVKAGFSLDQVADQVDTLANETGTFAYTDVLNYLSDVASFEKYGINGVDNPFTDQHNCDQRGRVYRRGDGTIGGLGYLPCYAWFTQRIGPANWHLGTRDLAAFATEQWQPAHNLTLSAGVRVEAEQLPPTIPNVRNPDLPATLKLPAATLNWGPRFGLAWSPFSGTVLRAGGGLYFGRIDNAAVLAALTQTGSPGSDLNFFFKPTDVGAPPFPYAFSVAPQTVVTPGAVAFAPRFRPQEVTQAVVSIEQQLPSHLSLTASAEVSLGRRLPISIDTNLVHTLDGNGNPETVTYDVVDSSGLGPLKAGTQLTVPFFTTRANANYQQISSIESRANSTYEAALVKLVRTGGHGLSLRAHYLYALATDWNPNESGNVQVNDVLDPSDFRLEYGTSSLDIRHSAAATVLYQTPWKLHHWAGSLVNGWSLAAVAQFRSGLPYTLRTGSSIPGFFDSTGKLVEGLGPSINGSAGDNRIYSIGRNTYRYPATYTGDARLGKRFDLHNHREIELLAESFNLMNHQNVTLIETTGYLIRRGTVAGGLPTLNFLTGLTPAGLPSTTPEFGKPLDINATNFYRQREFQLGLRARF